MWPLDLGLAQPLTNRPVFDLSGRHLGTPDLIDVTAGLAIQYNGSLHLAGKGEWDRAFKVLSLAGATA